MATKTKVAKENIDWEGSYVPSSDSTSYADKESIKTPKNVTYRIRKYLQKNAYDKGFVFNPYQRTLTFKQQTEINLKLQLENEIKVCKYHLENGQCPELLGECK